MPTTAQRQDIFSHKATSCTTNKIFWVYVCVYKKKWKCQYNTSFSPVIGPLQFSRKTKIDELDVAINAHHDILGLQISKHDVSTMEILEGKHYKQKRTSCQFYCLSVLLYSLLSLSVSKSTTKRKRRAIYGELMLTSQDKTRQTSQVGTPAVHCSAIQEVGRNIQVLRLQQTPRSKSRKLESHKKTDVHNPTLATQYNKRNNVPTQAV